jgi:PAS domain S-box-containing protein
MRCQSPDLSRVLDEMNLVFLEADAEGRLVCVEGPLADVLGYSEEEVLGRRFCELAAPMSRSFAESQLEEGLRADASASTYTMPIQSAYGSIVFIDVLAAPVVREGTPVGIRLLAHTAAAHLDGSTPTGEAHRY